MSQAERVIAKIAPNDRTTGVAILAEIAGVHPSRVHRWTYPKDREGTGGIIPAQHHQRILDGARERGIDLSPADFFNDDEPIQQARAS